MFAWQASDIPGVPREVIEHHLAICPHARPVKQKVRKQALERQEFITEKIRKLEAAGLVRGGDPSDVVGQPGSGAQGKQEVETVY